MSRILYANPDGSVAVIIPAPDCGLTLEEIAAKDVPRGLAWQIVEDTDLHADRTFRNAWTLQDGLLGHDMAQCMDLTKDRLRAARKPLLEAQDVLFQRALETGADTTAIIAEKQRLRDVTKLVTLEMTIEELKGVSV